MLHKALNFFHLLDFHGTISPFPEADDQSMPANAIPVQDSCATIDLPAPLERGEYSILDRRGYVLIAHITLPDVRRLAPRIARERKQCVRILRETRA
jgi:hypothetical protein